MKKILFIRRPGAYGGIEVLLLDWLKYINYNKNEVYLASNTDYFTEKIRHAGLPVTYKNFFLPAEGTFKDVYSSWFNDIKTISPDKIIIMKSNITEIPLASVLAAFMATRGNVFVTEHIASPFPPQKTRSRHFGIVPGIGLWWYKMMISQRVQGYMSKRILAVSEGVKNLLLMYGYKENKIFVTYHGIDISLYSPSAAKKADWRQRHDIPGEDLIFVSTSRLSPEKGIERTIKAFDALSQNNGNLWLLIAGDGPQKNEIKRIIDSFRCKDRIRLLGLVDNVPQLLQASDVFVLPSDKEGLSVSLTEAMSTGLVCIASDVSGSNEVIRDGENGFLVEPSFEGVLHGMKKVLELNVQARKNIIFHARNKIIEDFEINKSVTNIFRLLDIESI